ncbi:uncharacterized protein CTRU02_215498 [Colletotrichum truncatum]|uniref:Uncharacterized protein n=1 Tax=Colletotrichum truncatum TaxID=5467 RepID=A0ACC3YCQ3_COLTU|nr:uncharacterized protein CTRU02_05555 [Colletotrichum truncatum]KAF6793998.1 hypothetical protein CTRU02_05555 [Colletotrichum truncatum]
MAGPSFDWPDDGFTIGYEIPELPTYDFPTDGPIGGQPSSIADRAGSVVEQADQPSGNLALPLLRLTDWDSTKQYDKDNPVCIHYDFRWKVSQRSKIRARQVCSDTDLDLVLAPGDFWETTFRPRLTALLEDKDRFPADQYTCEETIIDISIERSRQRGLKKRFKGQEIDWDTLDSHIEGLGALFSKRRKITFGIEIVYKEAVDDATSAKGRKKGQNATEAQKLQRAADAGLWTRVYKHHRCRGKFCKQGPHCWIDERGNHHRLLPRHLEEIFNHIQRNMKEGEKEEEVNINIEIPSKILGDILNDSRKRKAEDSVDCRGCKAHALSNDRLYGSGETSFSSEAGEVEGDRMDRLEEYCDWNLQQVKDDKWREALQVANQFAMDQFLELNSILKHPKVAADLMVKGGVKPGIALQFVSNVKRFQQR